MGQIHPGFIADMLKHCERGEHPPLTVWEAQQLLTLAQRALAASPAPAPQEPAARFLLVAMDDDGCGNPVFCADEKAVRAALAPLLFFFNDEHPLSAEHDAEVDAQLEALLEDGFLRFEGDPGINLYKLHAPLYASPAPGELGAVDAPASLRGLDTPTRVRFYEHDFYVLSNFSAFNLHWEGRTFPTSEHAYHWSKFDHDEEGVLADLPALRYSILTAPSAHEAFKLAEANKAHRRIDWDDIKCDVMLRILRAKARQHEYVRRKLLATGDRELVEDSWRDDFWGWGPNRDGKNMLGRLWMQVRSELMAAPEFTQQAPSESSAQAREQDQQTAAGSTKTGEPANDSLSRPQRPAQE